MQLLAIQAFAPTPCPPPAVSGIPRSVTAPVGSKQVGGIRLSNLDLHGRLVRKGLLVSYGGIRLQVIKVYMGVFVGRKTSFGVVSGKVYQSDMRLKCESVQVVG